MSAGLALVTGGAGFVGSHVVDDLRDAGWEVRVLDALHPGAHAGRPDYLRDDVEYLFGDVRDAELTAKALAGVDAISHQAAMVGLGVDLSDAGDYVSHNSLGTATLIGAMTASGFNGPVVLAGSMVIYGEGAYECAEHGARPATPRKIEALDAGDFEPACPDCGLAMTPSAVGEEAAADPRNVYAATKLNQEHLLAAWQRESGGRFASLRYHNVYGPRMPRDTPYSGVAAIFRSALESGEAPRVFEDGNQMRDFVHVRDVARANRLALESDQATGAFNVASGEPRSVGEMARELAAVSDGPEPVVTGEYRLGDVRHVFASIDRARNELGYAPEVGFAEGIAEFATAELRMPPR